MSPTKTTTKVKLPPNPFIHEILELASKQRSKAKKIEILKEYETDALKTIFIWNFDDTVVSVVPEGEVPFKKNEVPVGTDHTSLRREHKNLYHFVKGGADNEHKQLREGYGHIPKPQARKIKNYLYGILEDARRYSSDRKPGRRKKHSK